MFKSWGKDPNSVIAEKLKVSSAMCKKSPKELKFFTDTLSNPQELKRKYLNKDFQNIKEMLEPIKIKKNNTFGSNSELDVSDDLLDISDEKIDVEKTEKIEKIEIEEDKEREHVSLAKYKQNDVLKSKIKVKLVVAEIANTEWQLQMRKFLSPITNTFGLTRACGLFHTALIIGPFYIEWNSSSLCIPRRCYSSAALLAIDLKESQLVELDIDQTIDVLSKTICKWNNEKFYDRVKCNCQHFVDDILKALGVELKFEKTMNEFVKRMRKEGECKIDWKISKEIQEKFSIKEDHKTFTSHLELDKFVNNLKKIEPMFEEKYREDYFLLKSFDRAFWLKSYSKSKTKSSECEVDQDGNCMCPFHDPEETKSLLSNWW